MGNIMKLSVVIPVYNEEKRIEKTAETLVKFFEKNNLEYELIFSNDGSLDSTYKIAKRLEEQNKCIKAVGYEVNKGKGSAVRYGMLKTSGDIVLFTDCDLAYGVDVIKNALDVFEKTGADIVIGSRNIAEDSYSGYTFTRKLMSKVYFRIIALVSGFNLSDSQCGFKCFNSKSAYDVFGECTVDGFAFDLEALIKAQKKGYKIAEMPVKILSNENDESKVNMIKDSVKMLKDIRKIKKSM